MLRITLTDTLAERLLLLEGKLMSVWVEELRNAWRKAKLELGNRMLTLDVSELSFVSSDGEQLLLEMIFDGAKFRGGGVYVRHLIQELEIRSRKLRDVWSAGSD